MDFWRLEKRGPSGKSVVDGKCWTGDGKVRVHYVCRSATGKTIRSHHEDLPPSLAARVGQRRRCPVCSKT